MLNRWSTFLIRKPAINQFYFTTKPEAQHVLNACPCTHMRGHRGYNRGKQVL